MSGELIMVLAGIGICIMMLSLLFGTLFKLIGEHKVRIDYLYTRIRALEDSINNPDKR